MVIGVTNASTIKSTTAGAFIMSAPDDVNGTGGSLWMAETHDTVSSTSKGSLLQGTLIGAGPAALIPGTGIDSLTDTAGSSNCFGDGGPNSIMIGGGGNTIHVGEFVLNTAGVAFPPLLSMSSRSTQVTLPTSGSGEPRARW